MRQLSLIAPVRVHYPELRLTGRVRLVDNLSVGRPRETQRAVRCAGSHLSGATSVSVGCHPDVRGPIRLHGDDSSGVSGQAHVAIPIQVVRDPARLATRV